MRMGVIAGMGVVYLYLEVGNLTNEFIDGVHFQLLVIGIYRVKPRVYGGVWMYDIK
jgi:hypothetical protein